MSVYKREWKDKQGRTRFCWYFHKTINGQRSRDRIPTARTRAQAEEGERKILAEIHAGVYGNRRNSQLLSDFIDKVYLPWSKANKRHPRHDEFHCKVINNSSQVRRSARSRRFLSRSLNVKGSKPRRFTTERALRLQSTARLQPSAAYSQWLLIMG